MGLDVKAYRLGSHKSPTLTLLNPMANIEITGANTLPTLRFSWDGSPLQAARHTSERVSARKSQLFIERLIYVVSYSAY